MRNRAAVISVISFFLCSLAFAGLGEKAGSDARAQLTEHPRYSLHSSLKKGVRFHEFSGSNGKVFAVAWNGKKHPDVKGLLGEHLAEFQTAIAQARAAHRRGGAIEADVGNLHLELGGHMGSTYGRAWLIDQLPSGMDAHEIK